MVGERPHGVTVLLPTRNSARWLRPALAGLAAQTRPADEVLIVDDNSTDSTIDLVRDYPLDGVRVLAGPGQGLAAALSLGVSEARFSLIARQDADDVSAPGRFAAQVEFLATHPEVLALGTFARQITEEGEAVRTMAVRTESSDVRFEASLWNPLLHPTVMMRTSAVLKAGNYRSPSSEPYPEDYDLWVRLLQLGDLASLTEPFVLYRANEQGLTRSNALRVKAHALEIGSQAARALLDRDLTDQEEVVRRMFLGRARRCTIREAVLAERLLLELRRAAGVPTIQPGTALATYLRPLLWLLRNPTI